MTSATQVMPSVSVNLDDNRRGVDLNVGQYLFVRLGQDYDLAGQRLEPACWNSAPPRATPRDSRLCCARSRQARHASLPTDSLPASGSNRHARAVARFLRQCETPVTSPARCTAMVCATLVACESNSRCRCAQGPIRMRPAHSARPGGPGEGLVSDVLAPPPAAPRCDVGPEAVHPLSAPQLSGGRSVS